MSILGEIIKEPEDLYKEHNAGLHKGQHYVYKNKCSECYKDYQSFLRQGERAMERRAAQ